MRDIVVQQGLNQDTVTAVGMGKDGPVADNCTNEGRQKNRRVEIYRLRRIYWSQAGIMCANNCGLAPAKHGSSLEGSGSKEELLESI